MLSGGAQRTTAADPAVLQSHAVAARDRVGLRGKTGIVENGIQKVAGAVAGKGPAGPVGTVRARSQAQDQQTGLLVAKRRNWLGPVNPVPVGTALAGGDLFAILPQAAAALTADDFLVEENQRTEIGGGRARIGRRHTRASSRRTGVRSRGMVLIPDCKAQLKDGVR